MKILYAGSSKSSSLILETLINGSNEVIGVSVSLTEGKKEVLF